MMFPCTLASGGVPRTMATAAIRRKHRSSWIINNRLWSSCSSSSLSTSTSSSIGFQRHHQHQDRHVQCYGSSSDHAVVLRHHDDLGRRWQQQRARSRCMSSSVRTMSTTITKRNVSTKADKRNNDKNTPTIGLFSISGLHHPSDFDRLTKQAIQESDSLRSTISSIPTFTVLMTPTQARETLYTLDQISKTVCNVIDAAELCRSAHASQEWRDAANTCFTTLQDYIATLNTDQNLYHALVYIATNFHDDVLSEEEQRFCNMLQREFELDGIHLPDSQRQVVKDLHNHVTTLETLFGQNIVQQTHQNSFWIDDQKNLLHDLENVIPRHVLEANGVVYNSTADENGLRAAQLTAGTPITNSILTYAPSSELRKEVYMHTMTCCSQNHDVLDALIDARHQLATHLKFDSYAHRFLQDKMARTPDNVMTFLNDLQTSIQPLYAKELNVIANAKRYYEGTTGDNGGSGNTTIVEPWDIKFYVNGLKQQQQQQHAAAGTEGEGNGQLLLADQLAPYLSLKNCLQSLKLLTHELFGIEMVEVAIQDTERWDIDALGVGGGGDGNYDENERIRKFNFYEEDSGRDLGIMYLDLHPRPNKYTHAAHFTVRCGCLIDGPGSDYQLPVVALVCNMSPGRASFTSHQEVETLFHEFGHALHSLLSRTNFQHLSGTRAAMDFVETPSHWMEHYAWDTSFLPILAKNATGESLPPSLATALHQSRNQFRYIEMQSQLVLAMFDQTIFGRPKGDGTNNGRDKPIQIWEDIHRKHGVPFASGTHWYTNVGHLVTYGAGYYCYLYSQVFANAIWDKHFDGGRCLSRESGTRMWKDLLIYGGAKDPNIMIEDLLGKDTKLNVSRLLH